MKTISFRQLGIEKPGVDGHYTFSGNPTPEEIHLEVEECERALRLGRHRPMRFFSKKRQPIRYWFDRLDWYLHCVWWWLLDQTVDRRSAKQ